MGKPDRKYFASLASKSGIKFKQDFSTAKSTDAYYLHYEVSALLNKSLTAELFLPPGDYLVVAQATLYNNNATGKYFGAILSYPEGPKTVTDVRGGLLASTNNTPPETILMNCAVSFTSKKSVKFQLGSSADVGFLAEEIKITALRLGSLTILAK